VKLFVLLLLTASFQLSAQTSADKVRQDMQNAELQRQADQEAKERDNVLQKYRVNEDGSLAGEKPKGDPELDKAVDDTLNDFKSADSDSGDDKKETAKSGKIEESFISKMMPGMMKSMVQKFLKTNPFSKMSKDEVKSMLLVQVEGKAVGKILKNNPRLLSGVVDWVRHPTALPQLMGIANEPKKVKYYGILVVFVFLVSFILNLLNSDGSIIRRIIFKLGITVGALGVNLGLFYLFFSDELGPTIDVIMQNI
jgi:hypothetical protein